MNEGAPVMYHANGGFGGPGMYMIAGDRQQHYQAEEQGGHSVGSPAQGTPRRWQRRDRQPAKTDSTAFGYDSDDSSLSSNASGSNKSGEKGDGSGGAASGSGAGSRWWRARRREPPRQRRPAPERYLGAAFQVKFTPDDLLTGSKYDTLSQEMWAKFIKSQQTEETFRRKMTLWRYLYINIKRIFPRCGLYVVGSTMSGFGLEASDMDLCLFARVPDGVEPRTNALLHLNYILAYVRSFDPADFGLEAELIQAKVPILKFRDPRHGLEVDLNCNNVVGIKNTSLLNTFSRMDWRVRPLVAVTKLWARAHNINDARTRTLSSYALTLMVIHFLQCGARPAVLPRAAGSLGAPCAGRGNRAPLGELFVQLLQYYAEFPFGRACVSVRAGRRLPARARELLCVEEPFDLSNTARSVYDPEALARIVAAFRASHERLARGLRLQDAWPASAAPADAAR